MSVRSSGNPRASFRDRFLGTGNRASNAVQTFAATGGTILTPGDGYKYHYFTASGTFDVSNVTGSGQVEYLVVAGGGGGGVDYFQNAPRLGCGGGAGGLRTNFPGIIDAASNPLTSISFLVGVGPYTITVGAGGAGATYDNNNPKDWRASNLPGTNGSSTLITSPYGSFEAIGGGGGASRHSAETNKAGSGGSGGGASGQYGNQGRALRGDMGYPGWPSGGQWYPGGGGGAGQRGMHGAETALPNSAGMTNNNAPNGGKGVQNSILGPAYWWAGGGGGSGYSDGSITIVSTQQGGSSGIAQIIFRLF